MSARPTIWTPEALTMLRGWHAHGVSTKWIALRLGYPFTKNAVIGKVRRLGLSGETPSSRARLANQRREAAPPPPPPPPPPTDTAVRFRDAAPRDCRWFLPGEEGASGYICGARSKAGRPYCEHHDRIATTYKPESNERIAASWRTA